MSEPNPIPNLTERQRQPDAVAPPPPDWGIGSLLNAQAEVLASAGAVLSDWLQRRQEAALDTRQLISRARVSAEPADAIRIQREFVSHFFQRLAIEVDACQATTQHLMERAPGWFPQGGWSWFPRIVGGTEVSASQSAGTRTVGRPIRMANHKSD